MATPILATKLFIPPLRPKVVLRPRLIERMNEGRHTKLTLICAPAGFGKTTLVSEWIADCRQPIAWLSLDEGDNDQVRFLTYLVAALRTIKPGIGEGLLAALQSPQPPQAEAILTTLLNEISVSPEKFILILDDYHLIDSQPVDHALAFLVEHQPLQMHLVIATREDPDLPLARLRARGQLTELRASDLRFTPAEAAEFLNQAMGLNLSVENITALEARTEGWIAGLQLAALSMQNQEDIPGFIQAFTGSHHFVLDYLIEEVLEQQSQSVQAFLLRTSILDRLCGPLCDAVLLYPSASGQKTLEYLEHANLFIVPLDNERHWYRYHHLFADVLRMHLMAEQPDQVSALHRCASEWYEKNGSTDNAIRHALAAKDFERAATLIELAEPEMRRSRQGGTPTELGWLKALPDELVHFRPVLSVAYAFALFGGGELGGVEPRLRDAERWLDAPADIRARPESPAAGMVVVDEEEFRRLPGMIALLRAAQALARGDMSEAVKNAQRVLDLAPEDAHLMLGGAASILGLAAWASGDLEAARRMTADGMTNVRQASYISSAIGGSVVLADILIAQGRLHEAMTTYEQGLQWAMESGAPVMRGEADMHVGMSALHREHNDLKAATQHLLTSQTLGELAGLQQNPYRWCAAMARVREAQGDLDGALNLLDQAERLYDANFSPNVRPIATRKTRVWVVQGRLGEALGWAREQGLSIENKLSYLREFDHITFARVLIARHKADGAEGHLHAALGLLARLRQAAEEGARNGSLIEILILQSLAHQAQGDQPRALVSLERALTLAEPEGYVRIFVDEGEAMRLLIEEQSRSLDDPLSDYADKLLAAFPQPAAAPKSAIIHPESDKIEPLSERELEVLRLLRSELSGPEIAQQLIVSLNTLRTHTKNIFNKLGVNNRRAAIRRAEELDLF